MRILRLDQILPGDVILETGSPLIADATGGLYGHASVALGKLVKIEAENLKGGVVVNPFALEAWHKGGERVVGVTMEHDVLVLRKSGLNIGTVVGEALWEAGRHYSLHKLLELADLRPESRKRIERLVKLQPQSAAEESEGRFCSEVAARVLRLPDKMLSPNRLASASELQRVEEAVADLSDEWVVEAVETAKNSVAIQVSELRLGLAQRAIDQATELVEEMKAEAISQEDAVTELDCAITDDIFDAMRTLKQIRALEPTILHTETSTL